ncbi:MAG: ABC transporter substrate-binding protein [Caldilineaceae bacterium]
MVVEVVDDYNVNIMPPTPDVTFLRTMAEDAYLRRAVRRRGQRRHREQSIGTGSVQVRGMEQGRPPGAGSQPGLLGRGQPYLAEVIFRPIPESSTLRRPSRPARYIVNRLNSDEAASPRVSDVHGDLPGRPCLLHHLQQPDHGRRSAHGGQGGAPGHEPCRGPPGHRGRPLQRQRASTGFVTPSNLGFDDTLEPYPYDPETAKQLLADAGYADGFSIGTSCPVGAYTNFEDVCQAIANYLGEVGITLDGGEIEFLESGVYWDREAARTAALFGDSWSASVGEALPCLNGALTALTPATPRVRP